MTAKRYPVNKRNQSSFAIVSCIIFMFTLMLGCDEESTVDSPSVLIVEGNSSVEPDSIGWSAQGQVQLGFKAD